MRGLVPPAQVRALADATTLHTTTAGPDQGDRCHDIARGAAATGAVSSAATGGAVSAGISTIASKAATGLAAAAIVSVGAVEVQREPCNSSL